MKDDDETPQRDRPIMPHVAELAGEHRGERNDLDDKTRQWLVADEAAKTTAWLAANHPAAHDQYVQHHQPGDGERWFTYDDAKYHGDAAVDGAGS